MTENTPNSDSTNPADSQSPEEARRKKLEQIIALGHDPYGHRFDDRDLLGDIRKRSDEIRYVLEDGTELEIPDLSTLGDGGLKAWAKEQGKGTLQGPKVRAAGYDVLFIDELALAPDQSISIDEVDTSGDLFARGFSFGVKMNY